jgi:hypothetical protein
MAIDEVGADISLRYSTRHKSRRLRDLWIRESPATGNVNGESCCFRYTMTLIFSPPPSSSSSLTRLFSCLCACVSFHFVHRWHRMRKLKSHNILLVSAISQLVAIDLHSNKKVFFARVCVCVWVCCFFKVYFLRLRLFRYSTSFVLAFVVDCRMIIMSYVSSMHFPLQFSSDLFSQYRNWKFRRVFL